MEIVDGKYTGEIDFYAYAENKATAIARAGRARGYDLARSYAYSDSITDVPHARGRRPPATRSTPTRSCAASPASAAGRSWSSPAGRAAQPDAAARRPSRRWPRSPSATAVAVGGAIYLGARRRRRGAWAADRHGPPGTSPERPGTLVRVRAGGVQRRTTTPRPAHEPGTHAATYPSYRALSSGSPGATVDRCTLGNQRSHVSAAALSVMRRSAARMYGPGSAPAGQPRERAGLGAGGVGLGGVEQPGVHAGRAALG